MLRKIAKQLCPPILLNLGQSLRSRLSTPSHLHITGNYTSWEEATLASTGYDSDHILEKTKQALLKVKNGEAVYERDSVLFDEIQYSWPLLAGLMWVAARSDGRLNVLDFGGSLGSTFFQNREFFRSLSEVRWNIVEQPKHVKVGKEFFEDGTLRFYSDIDTYSAENTPDVIVLSGVLQCIENPHELMNKLMNLPSKSIIIDLTPFWFEEDDILCVEYVPSDIYQASYPYWVFSEKKFTKNIIESKWKILTKFDTLTAPPATVNLFYKGMIIIKD